VPRFFSDISYSLYLVQGPLLLLLAKLKPTIGFGNAAALVTLTAIGSAYLIHRFVERPFIAWGRRFSNRVTKNSPGEVVRV
jgi:peptidoglycan/LPS O-acetylase OafA/YrhL